MEKKTGRVDGTATRRNNIRRRMERRRKEKEGRQKGDRGKTFQKREE